MYESGATGPPSRSFYFLPLTAIPLPVSCSLKEDMRALVDPSFHRTSYCSSMLTGFCTRLHVEKNQAKSKLTPFTPGRSILMHHVQGIQRGIHIKQKQLHVSIIAMVFPTSRVKPAKDWRIISLINVWVRCDRPGLPFILFFTLCLIFLASEITICICVQNPEIHVAFWHPRFL